MGDKRIVADFFVLVKLISVRHFIHSDGFF